MTLLEDIERRIQSSPHSLKLSDAEIDALSEDDISALIAQHGSTVLMHLNDRERTFFDWVKEEDPDVWNDLWADDEDQLVTLAFLKNLGKRGNGFPICELETTDNYYFTIRHIKPDGIEALYGILDKVESGAELSIAEALMFELLSHPIDIWHFCYKYGIPLSKGKATVGELEKHDWLIHLTARADIIKYIDES